MNTYHKIKNIWEREREGRERKLIENAWATPEFAYLKDSKWLWEEKVDGTNIRILVNETSVGTVEVRGKTDNAQVPPRLMAAISDLLDADKLIERFPEGACLYGEGYGVKIQKVGASYLPDSNSFILFDVRVGKWWLERNAVTEIAESLGIKRTPIAFIGTPLDAIAFTRKGFKSGLGEVEAEGLIGRPLVPLLCRSGERIITKIKTKDLAR